MVFELHWVLVHKYIAQTDMSLMVRSFLKQLDSPACFSYHEMRLRKSAITCELITFDFLFEILIQGDS